MVYLRVIFLVLFVLEVYQTKFKYSRDKWIWFFVVLIFGVYGYSFYLAFKRRLIVRRKFNPNFNHLNL